MTHREAICKKCRKKWNISIGRDTSNGYVCPICSFKERRMKIDQGRDTEGRRADPAGQVERADR
jgi:hypothetical protein